MHDQFSNQQGEHFVSTSQPSANEKHLSNTDSADEYSENVVVLRRKKVSNVHPDGEEVHRSSVTYQSSSDEDESVSVTTGRLSLTLSHSSDKDGVIDVTAATVQKEEVQTHLTTRNKNQTISKKLSNETSTRKSGNNNRTIFLVIEFTCMV